MINIIILSFVAGLLAGQALVYTIIKSYLTAAIVAGGSLINLGLLLYVLSLRESIP